MVFEVEESDDVAMVVEHPLRGLFDVDLPEKCGHAAANRVWCWATAPDADAHAASEAGGNSTQSFE